VRLSKISVLCGYTLKEGIGGEREGDFMDNSTGVVKPHPMLCVDLIACRRKGLTNFMMNLHVTPFIRGLGAKRMGFGISFRF
jgi:hypothetical protein